MTNQRPRFGPYHLALRIRYQSFGSLHVTFDDETYTSDSRMIAVVDLSAHGGSRLAVV